uniref:Uncharacterized protein n=1 Tax=Anguilla anguilla TaxID=7936 RepID=A0A0E9R8X1_ANGAN
MDLNSDLNAHFVQLGRPEMVCINKSPECMLDFRIRVRKETFKTTSMSHVEAGLIKG